MKRVVVLLLSLLVPSVLLLAGCVHMRDPYLLSDVITRSERGVSANTIIGSLRTSRTTYALRGSDFARLRAVGVPDQVLDYLQQSFVNDVALVVRYWMGGDSLGKCAKCYPQQVDLGSLQKDGAVRQMPPPLRTTPGRALGLPDWYHSTKGYSASGGITVDELRDLARSGMTDAQLLKELRTRPLVDVIGTGSSFHLGSTVTAGLTGSMLADLHDEGLSDAVLDELQANYLAVYVEYLRMRYLQDGRGAKP
ncbi:MAG: hypothetical protein GC151_16220 [Betaproteobacteria bacterium]|nr:hypothetical protein [Betaproteobacteria bacterium]